MCIRDRRWTVVDGCGNEAMAMQTITVGGGGVPILVPNHACLLYTSDAADERSSVDLGGRRILKKKKTNTRRQWGES